MILNRGVWSDLAQCRRLENYERATRVTEERGESDQSNRRIQIWALDCMGQCAGSVSGAGVNRRSVSTGGGGGWWSVPPVNISPAPTFNKHGSGKGWISRLNRHERGGVDFCWRQDDLANVALCLWPVCHLVYLLDFFPLFTNTHLI